MAEKNNNISIILLLGIAAVAVYALTRSLEAPKDLETSGSLRPLDEPEGEEPEGDEPEGDEPEGDEPEGDELEKLNSNLKSSCSYKYTNYSQYSSHNNIFLNFLNNEPFPNYEEVIKQFIEFQKKENSSIIKKQLEQNFVSECISNYLKLNNLYKDHNGNKHTIPYFQNVYNDNKNLCWINSFLQCIISFPRPVLEELKKSDNCDFMLKNTITSMLDITSNESMNDTYFTKFLQSLENLRKYIFDNVNYKKLLYVNSDAKEQTIKINDMANIHSYILLNTRMTEQNIIDIQSSSYGSININNSTIHIKINEFSGLPKQTDQLNRFEQYILNLETTKIYALNIAFNQHIIAVVSRYIQVKGNLQKVWIIVDDLFNPEREDDSYIRIQPFYIIYYILLTDLYNDICHYFNRYKNTDSNASCTIISYSDSKLSDDRGAEETKGE
uniref:Uncharacterized protein n=1 Tax=Megaviridae environmental sample TaxID=1737588 RepID=A0A5J6VIG8_9VIRU|nr:MAG: hypothetical protein [Megaviridae environmental sample]